jgi:hypothetical protein
MLNTQLFNMADILFIGIVAIICAIFLQPWFDVVAQRALGGATE